MKVHPTLLTAATLALLLGLFGPQDTLAAEAAPLRWIDGASLTVGGKGWTETAGPFERLPLRAKGIVRGPVYSLGRDSAGVFIDFETDSPVLQVRWKLVRERIAMPHMPATGVSGLDLYVQLDGAWRWVAVARPNGAGQNSSELFSGRPQVARTFRLYLPLYNIVEKLEIGVTADAQIRGGRADPRPPVVFYGTSAVQGGCASRPGMSYPALMGRRLAQPVVNLGFDGNGKAEPEMATLLATIQAAAYVIDCLPNLLPEEASKVESFVATLRASQPATPILLVENVEYPDAVLNDGRRARHVNSNRILREIFGRLSPADPNLHYLPAKELLGSDNDATVDGSHPTDLGFTRIADVMMPAILRAIESPRPVITPKTSP